MDKLILINRALSATGNNQIVVLGDGGDEWIAADNAFERAVAFVLSQNVGAFAKDTLLLTRLGAAEVQPFVHAMQYPADCWHLRSVLDEETGQPVQYAILNNRILTHSDNVRALYIRRPDENVPWHGAILEYITLSVEAELRRGLNDDVEAGVAMMKLAQNNLISALTKVDQQSGPRQAKLSRAGSARRARKF
jgi:hypothetical protein